MQQPQTNVICDHCGAQIPVQPGLTILTCRYCGSSKSLIPATGPTAADFKFLVPTTADGAKVRAAIRQALIEGSDAPDDVLDAGRFVEEGFHFRPVWLGKGTYRSHWSASFGFNRQETYTDFETRTDSRGRSFQQSVTRSRTVTDWRPASGTSAGRFSMLLFAGDQGDLPPEAVGGLEAAAPLGTQQPFNAALLGGLEAMEPTLPAEEAERLLTARVERGPAADSAHEHAKGDVQRDWAVDTEVAFEGPLKLGLIPVAKAVYEYKGARHPVWFEGAELSANWHGPLPADRGRGRLKLRGYLPFLAGLLVCVAWVAWCLQSNATIWPHAAVLGLALVPALIFGAARSRSLENHSRAVRRASMARARLAEADRLGTPLAQPERDRLQQECRNQERPWLARTANDARRILIGALLVAVLAAFGFNDGPFSLAAKARDWFGGEDGSGGPAVSAETVQTRTAQAEPAQAEPSQTKTAQAEPSQTKPAQAELAQSRPSQTKPAQSRPTPSAQRDQSGPFNLASLNCSVRRCLDSAGRPVDGLVYEVRGQGAWPPASMGRYRGGVPDGTAVYFDASMSVEEIRSFRRGTEDGLRVRFYEPEGGRQSIARVGVVSEGKLHGPVFGFDSEGNVSSYGRYEGGAKDGDWYEYHPDGSVKSLTGYRRGGGRTGWRSWEPGERAGAPPEFPAQDDLDRLISEARAIRSQAMKLRP